MVKPKIELLKWGIQNTKMRIKKGEKAGMGDFTMKEKNILKKQERKLQTLRDKGLKV